MRFNIRNWVTRRTVNHEGAPAYSLTPEMELYTAVVTWSLNDTFYEKDGTRIDRIRELVARCAPDFVGRLAVYARTQMHLRSVPLVLATELARRHSGTDLVSRVTDGVVRRADEITELLSCYAMMNDRVGTKKLNRLSKQVQKGLATAFNRFDEYQFAKYNRKAAITLRDALFLVHPKAKDEAQQHLFDRIATGAMQTPYTWETELSAIGQQHFGTAQAMAEARKATWEQLIDSHKLGYMASMRNLRNILTAGVSPVHVERVCAMLADASNVAKSRQFPFRYLAAYRELLAGSSVSGMTGMVLDALETAIQASTANIRGFDAGTRVLIACDVSGSMQKTVSAKSSVMLYDIGLVLAMLLQSRCANVRVGMFGDTWKIIPVPRKNVLANVQSFHAREGEVGYATNGHLVIQDLLDSRTVADKVMLFTDCQLWDAVVGTSKIQRAWAAYRQQVAPDARLYLFDLQGYGQSPLQLRDNGVRLIAGWSDRIFEVLDAIEDGQSALDVIRRVTL